MVIKLVSGRWWAVVFNLILIGVALIIVAWNTNERLSSVNARLNALEWAFSGWLHKVETPETLAARNDILHKIFLDEWDQIARERAQDSPPKDPS